MQTEIQQLTVYYKGQILPANFYTFDRSTQQINFKKQLERRFLKVKWEVITNE